MSAGRVTILAVGVSQYVSLDNLRGPRADLVGVEWLFTDPNIGLYDKSDVNVFENPTSQQIREWLLKYVCERTAVGDILVFYFSGHGTVVGPGEFAFCLSDTAARNDSADVFPLSVLHFGDVVDTLTSVDVYPVFIIDACYSGAAAQSHQIASGGVIALMHDTMHRRAGSSYAILCACSSRRTTVDDLDGGVFTKLLMDILEEGLPGKQRQKTVALDDIFPILQESCEQTPDLNAPRLYLGPSLPKFALCRNAAYQELTYTFTAYMADLVRAMWNRGSPRSLKLAQIRELSAGAYGNHRKLSFAPWGLLENGASAKERRLSARGRDFAEGKLKVPQLIRANDSNTASPASWERVPGSSDVGIADF
jgi:hypothetical protein